RPQCFGVAVLSVIDAATWYGSGCPSAEPGTFTGLIRTGGPVCAKRSKGLPVAGSFCGTAKPIGSARVKLGGYQRISLSVTPLVWRPRITVYHSASAVSQSVKSVVVHDLSRSPRVMFVMLKPI